MAGFWTGSEAAALEARTPGNHICRNWSNLETVATTQRERGARLTQIGLDRDAADSFAE